MISDPSTSRVPSVVSGRQLVSIVQTPDWFDTRGMSFDPSSKDRLTDHDLGRFPDDTLFHRLARAVCHAGCLPRKELFEAWETARRVRRVCRGGRVVDLGGGHGLLAQVLLLLDDTSPDAIVVDAMLPPSHATLHAAIVAAWPRLAGRVRFEARRFGESRF